MTLFDFVVIGIVALSIILGVLRGAVKETLSIVNLVVAFWVANQYGDQLILDFEWTEGLSPAMKALIGCAVAFFAMMVVGAILIRFLSRIVTSLGLSFADRGLGAAFGAARGVLIVLVLVTGAGFTNLPKQEFWKEALLSATAVEAMKDIKPHLPESVAQWVKY